MDVILETERDRRTFAWLIEQAGADAVEQACSQLAGQRKPYVSNLAKVLGLEPPDTMRQPSKEEARARLAALKTILQAPRG